MKKDKNIIKIVDNNKEWNLIFNEVEYNFYYSEAKPIKGLILNGCDTQLKEYQIGNNKIYHTIENSKHILNVEAI